MQVEVSQTVPQIRLVEARNEIPGPGLQGRRSTHVITRPALPLPTLNALSASPQDKAAVPTLATLPALGFAHQGGDSTSPDFSLNLAGWGLCLYECMA